MAVTNAINLNNLSDGQLLIGRTGLYPAPGLISSGGNMIITAGAGTLSLQANCYTSTNVVTISSSGTYTKPANLVGAYVIVSAAGGGGGGANTAGAGLCTVGGGGAGGGVAEKWLLASAIGVTEVVTIGNGGTAGTSAGIAGGRGGASSFGIHCVASGGFGGNSGATAAAVRVSTGGSGGIGTTGDILIQGTSGESGWASFAAGIACGGASGANYLSTGIRSSLITSSSSSGLSPATRGAGAPGSAVIATTGVNGLSGAQGRIYVIEYLR